MLVFQKEMNLRDQTTFIATIPVQLQRTRAYACVAAVDVVLNGRKERDNIKEQIFDADKWCDE